MAKNKKRKVSKKKKTVRRKVVAPIKPVEEKQVKHPAIPDKLTLNIRGTSVDFASVIRYFGFNERADMIEAEIQRRTAAIAISRAGGRGDMMKSVAIICIIIIVGAIAYGMIQSSSGGQVNTNAIVQAIQKATGAASSGLGTNVVTGQAAATGTKIS